MSHSCQLPSPICLPPAMGSMFLADAVNPGFVMLWYVFLVFLTTTRSDNDFFNNLTPSRQPGFRQYVFFETQEPHSLRHQGRARYAS